jgi:uncharacterized protein (UPF0276 family)
MPYTFAAARVTAEKIRQARDYLEVPICVENVSSYAEFHASEMTEWEFLSEVVEIADCGILLDVNNIYVSAQNHNFTLTSIWTTFCTIEWAKFTLPATRNLKNTFLIHMTIRSWTPCGRCMPTQ